MANELTRNQMTRPATGSSSVGSQRAGPLRDVVPRSIDQSRPAYCTGLCGSGPRVTIQKLSCVPCNIRVSFPATNNCSEDVLVSLCMITSPKRLIPCLTIAYDQKINKRSI
ncbi:hypothetical protein Bca4012_006279 [Brassica carinata]